MHERIITTGDLYEMFRVGALNLSANSEYVNSINVFPIPDGDTGTNMNATISGAVKAGQSAKDKPIGEFSQIIAKAAVMNARGNSGVILSQFIKGMSLSLAGKTEVDVKGFADAMNAGWEKSYEVVANPTEGTMLTVMREAGEKTAQKIEAGTTIGEYIFAYCNEARASLMRTPELLPVLKKAGVIDSGGAGFTYIAEGMMKAVNGEEVSSVSGEVAATASVDTSAFNADSELTFGYCTEFILQLQNAKVDTASFPLSTVTDYLDSVGGESVVAFKDDDIIKVHVHTFDPGKILSEIRKYGEFLTVKIENMNLQHSENIEYFEKKGDKPSTEHKKFATVVVASGEGVADAFSQMGVDEVVSGGQTMNTSTQDFLDAFDKVDADNIFVYPNNSNIVMAANLAAQSYDKAKVRVIPTKTIAEGYSAISMLDVENDDFDSSAENQKEVASFVTTIEVTYSVRDTTIDGFDVRKNDYICISGKKLVACSKSRVDAVKAALDNTADFSDKQLMTVFAGKDSDNSEIEEIKAYAESKNKYIEVCVLIGGQDVYSYIIGLE